MVNGQLDGDFDGVSDHAQRLHALGILSGFIAGHPGWVEDGYLARLQMDTTTATFELELLGLWQRGVDGYVVNESELLRVVTIIDRQLRAASDHLRPDPEP